MHYTAAYLSVFCLLSAGSALAEGCADYPYTPGVTVEDVNGGTKILATAATSVSFDDVDAINDAHDEATLAAKAMITKFLQEDVHSDEAIRRDVAETKSMQGDSKKVQRAELVQRVKQLSSHSSGLLRGVVPLGDCYTAGKELRVSVGLKPETIAAAGNAANGMSNSLAQSPSPSSPAPTGSTGTASTQPSAGATSTSQPLNRMPSYSNTQRLNGF